jgi:hypothetical protein
VRNRTQSILALQRVLIQTSNRYSLTASFSAQDARTPSQGENYRLSGLQVGCASIFDGFIHPDSSVKALPPGKRCLGNSGSQALVNLKSFPQAEDLAVQPLPFIKLQGCFQLVSS